MDSRESAPTVADRQAGTSSPAFVAQRHSSVQPPGLVDRSETERAGVGENRVAQDLGAGGQKVDFSRADTVREPDPSGMYETGLDLSDAAEGRKDTEAPARLPSVNKRTFY